MAGPGSFIGRAQQLRLLREELDAARMARAGRFVVLRGRRRVGKSRLVEEFLRRVGPPHVFFAAIKGRAPSLELARFSEAIETSTLPAADLIRSGARVDSWEAALTLIARTSEPAEPAVVVVDEFPYLVEEDRSVEGAFQNAWDRALERAPIVLVLVGSDLAMMSALAEYGRPLFGRPTRSVELPPLNPAEIAAMLDLDPAGAFDAYLVLGGSPQLARSWGDAKDASAFVRRELVDPASPLIVAGERIVAAEFPPDAQARLVLSAIGSGQRTYSAIASASGVPRQSLERALDLLVTKRVVERMEPLSARPSRQPRYIVSDTYLRFWLRFVDPGLNEIERGRGDLVSQRFVASWREYRGRAVEPIVQDAIERMLPSAVLGDTDRVGSYWTRNNGVEVDLVGVSSRPPRVTFVGSIKWRERSPFGGKDLGSLLALRTKVPGNDDRARLVGVSRSGFSTDALDVSLEPQDLLRAWSAS